MPPISISTRLLKKSEAALLSAMEVYNKPSFPYREETFVILMLNAWELMLKARWLTLNSNGPRSLYVYEKRPTKTGKPSSKRFIKKNRSGNAQTLGLGQLIVRMDAGTSSRLHPEVKSNLDALIEIRDNAVHFMNASPTLAKQVLEIGTAALQNYVELARRWFRQDLSRYHLYLLPLGFLPAPGAATALSISDDESKLIQYLYDVVQTTQREPASDLHVALEVNLSVKRSVTSSAATMGITTDPSAPKFVVTEEDIRQKYPWDYKELTDRLKQRYSDFKENQRYHEIRRPLLDRSGFVNTRYLEPGNSRSSKKDFYNPNIIREFDKHYTLK